ncbi:MAG: exodeoxyribonuclease VII small subunit [Spirochaetales bacterium]|nr:exodeoxyribonuclease VII small subunit [Spirochaetales bacterium]
MANFEENLTRLEELSEQIQDGDIPLEEAVKVFEEGIRLAKKLEKDLTRIERKIEILKNNPAREDEKPEMELFPELDDE